MKQLHSGEDQHAGAIGLPPFHLVNELSIFPTGESFQSERAACAVPAELLQARAVIFMNMGVGVERETLEEGGAGFLLRRVELQRVPGELALNVEALKRLVCVGWPLRALEHARSLEELEDFSADFEKQPFNFFRRRRRQRFEVDRAVQPLVPKPFGNQHMEMWSHLKGGTETLSERDSARLCLSFEAKPPGEPSLMGKHYNETGITLLPNGDILAAMRSENGGHLAITRSTDKGKAWSAPEQMTADMEHPADLIVLKDGRVLLTYGERNEPRGVHAMLSKDSGKSWDKANEIVLAKDAPNTDCGYPSSVELSSGEILTIYYQVDDAKNAPASAKAKSIVWKAPR